MKRLYLKEILLQIGGEVIQGTDDIFIKYSAIVPGRLTNNTLYFDLLDYDFDFEQYEACAIVVSNRNTPAIDSSWTVIVVDEVEKALMRFVQYYRGLFNIPVIAVTGTCGKTTTKDMIKHILSMYFRTVSTYKSINGWRRHLPYLLEIDDDIKAAVFETAVSSPSDLIESCQYFKPAIGVITNIGIDHLDGCDTFDNYLKAKAEIIEGLGYSGTLILNSDDKNIEKINLKPFKGKVIYFGLSKKSDFRASNIKLVGNGMEFILQYQNLSYEIFVPGYGEHTVYNALAAIVSAYVLGFGIKEAGERLKTFEHLERHLQLFSGINGCTVIDDTWSSNPTSVEAALKVLKSVSGEKKKIAILGSMYYLFDLEKELHSRIGDLVVETGLDILVTVGELAGEIAKRAVKIGMNKNNVYTCEKPEEVYKVIYPLLNHNSIVLIKKSMKDSFGDLVDKIIVKS